VVVRRRFRPQDEEKEDFFKKTAMSLIDPNWISQQIFGPNLPIGSVLVIKLLIVPVEPAFFTSKIVRITKNNYGYLHTALQISGSVVDWNSSGLCVPREFSQSVRAALDICSGGTEKVKNTVQVMRIVSEFIAKQNNFENYSNFSKNCQHFVDDLLKAMSIDIKWNPCIVTYLNEIRQNPNNVTPHIRYTVDGKYVRVDFKTHEELDIFIEMFKVQDPCQYLELGSLLKAFDRGFWFQDMIEGKFQPSPNCPWTVPTGYEVYFEE